MELRTGFYRGIVKRHELNGCCKVFVPGVYDKKLEDEPNQLPNAEIATPVFGGGNTGAGGSGNSRGMFSYPNIDTKVWVFFQNGDQNYPVIFAQSLGGDGASANYNSVIGAAGKENDSFFHTFYVKDSKIKISEEGSIEITTANGINCDEHGDSYATIKLNKNGEITLDSSATININTKVLNINASSNINLTTPKFCNTTKNFTNFVTGDLKVVASNRIFLGTPNDNKMYS